MVFEVENDEESRLLLVKNPERLVKSPSSSPASSSSYVYNSPFDLSSYGDSASKRGNVKGDEKTQILSLSVSSSSSARHDSIEKRGNDPKFYP